jgi:hypothetical protein
MRAWRFLLLVTILAVALGAGLAHAADPGWTLYKGAFFDIKYPSNFSVVKREPGNGTEPGQVDGASFKSPDGKVEFYVFSPQWEGTPTWFRKRPGEKCVSYKQTKKNEVTTTWVTYRGPGGAYERSYVDSHDTRLNTRKIFGFQYRNKSAYQTYRARYLKFKGSLIQYAD